MQGVGPIAIAYRRHGVHLVASCSRLESRSGVVTDESHRVARRHRHHGLARATPDRGRVAAHRCRPGETAHLQRALELGAGRGFLATYLREDELVKSDLRRLVDSDPRWRSSPLAFALHSRPAASAPDRYVLIEPLSAKEREVLRLLSSHLSTVEIAQRLFVSANTVRTHIKAIYRKLDVGRGGRRPAGISARANARRIAESGERARSGTPLRRPDTGGRGEKRFRGITQLTGGKRSAAGA